MFRDLTQSEREVLYDQCMCPFCGGTEFYEGPHGGMSINWYCANEKCLAGFNLAPPGLHFAQLIRESYVTIADQGATMGERRLPEPELKAIFKRKSSLRAWLNMLKSTQWGV